MYIRLFTRMCLPVKQAGIALPDPAYTSGANWKVSYVITENLITVLRRMIEYRSSDHTLLLGKGREDIRWRHKESAKTALGEAMSAASKTDARRMGSIQRTGEWLYVLPFTVNGTELGAQELWYYLFLRYGIKPPDLTDCCIGCGAVFLICHPLDCNKGGLITESHNELHDGVANLTVEDFPPTRTCLTNPRFSQVAPCVVVIPKAKES